MNAAPILSPADPSIARRTRTLLMTFAIASWCSVVLGIRDVNVLLVVIFAWTSSAALRLAAPQPERGRITPLWNADFAVKASLGVALWIVLPALKVSFPAWWVWQPLVVPGQITGTGATVALCWALRPFWVQVPADESNGSSLPGMGIETLLLCSSLFFVSGSPVFAAFAIACALLMLAQTIRSRSSVFAFSTPRAA